MEGVTWMRDVVVQDAPSADAEYPPRLLDCGTTVVYEWSPIMYLGDLLDFLLDSRNRAAVPTTLSSKSTSSSTCSTPMESGSRMGALNHDLNSSFPEEHKMEDGVAAHHHLNLYFPPNRFDVGYGKYMDLLAQQQACSNNAMDVN
jgi:hypothetical protein